MTRSVAISTLETVIGDESRSLYWFLTLRAPSGFENTFHCVDINSWVQRSYDVEVGTSHSSPERREDLYQLAKLSASCKAPNTSIRANAGFSIDTQWPVKVAIHLKRPDLFEESLHSARSASDQAFTEIGKGICCFELPLANLETRLAVWQLSKSDKCLCLPQNPSRLSALLDLKSTFETAFQATQLLHSGARIWLEQNTQVFDAQTLSWLRQLTLSYLYRRLERSESLSSQGGICLAKMAIFYAGDAALTR